MNVDQFDFNLPDSAIALRPAKPRDAAKLLCVSERGKRSDHHVRDLPALLRTGDVLVINDTRVLPAAMTAIRPARSHGGGGDVKIGINLHKRVDKDRWRAFVKPAKRLRCGDKIHLSDKLLARVSDKKEGGDVELTFNLSGEALDAEITALGHPPLPPYIARQRDADDQDVNDYQTVYAKDRGSVAAPTAGLHFTQSLLAELTSKGVQVEAITLHVGAGTFLPVKTGDTKDHIMHSEWYSLSERTATILNEAKQSGQRVIAVGTTALRALESSIVDGKVVSQTRETDIFITPGYRFWIDGLMTNFHLPRSTLFMLVSAVCGIQTMQDAYRYALETGYRFYSYGDSSLLWVNEDVD